MLELRKEYFADERDDNLEIGGKLAALGEGVLGRKTRDMLHDFAARLDRLLNPPPDTDTT